MKLPEIFIPEKTGKKLPKKPKRNVFNGIVKVIKENEVTKWEEDQSSYHQPGYINFCDTYSPGYTCRTLSYTCKFKGVDIKLEKEVIAHDGITPNGWKRTYTVKILDKEEEIKKYENKRIKKIFEDIDSKVKQYNKKLEKERQRKEAIEIERERREEKLKRKALERKKQKKLEDTFLK